MNRAVALLQAGRLSEAWPEYEWRLSLPGHQALDRERLLPAVSTLGDLTGKTILVTHEEGFGDTLQFLRYLPLLAERGARVAGVGAAAACARAAVRTWRGRGTRAATRATCNSTSTARSSACRAHSRRRWRPFQPPCLTCLRIRQWRQAGRNDCRLTACASAWSGPVRRRPWLPGFDVVDARRSMPLATLAPLAEVPGVSLVSLQMGAGASEVEQPATGLDAVSTR